MRIRIRIYAEREPELYALYKACGPSLTRKIFRKSVCAYIDGTSLGIDVPAISDIQRDSSATNPMFDISIPSEYEHALSNLPDRQTSTFVKTLVRYYVFWQLSEAFRVPHQEVQNPMPVSQPAPETATQKSSAKVVSITQEKEAPKKAEPQNIQSIENSDVNSLAALFGAITTS